MQTTPTPDRAEHMVAFFQPDGLVVDEVSAFIAEGLAMSDMVIAVATAPHWRAITARLHRDGIAHERAEREGRLRFIDAEEVLAAITVDREASVERFRSMLEALVVPGSHTRVYGEVVSLLAQRGEVDAAIAIERLGHDLAHTGNVRALCGYHVDPQHPFTPSDIARIQQAHDRTISEGTLAVPRSTPDKSSCHAVRFYQNRDSLARIVGHFLGEGFIDGLPAIVIATPEHREAIRDVLTTRFFDVSRLEATGNLIMADARALLETFMVDGMPDPTRFQNEVTPLIEKACRGREDCVVRAYGEMVDILWKAGDTVAAVRLERLWNQLAGTHSFALLCGYSMGHFYKGSAHDDVRALHTHLVSDNGELTAH
jgi:KaiC/GvpD/RAD55 family RecA-like ATPase